MQDTLVSHDLQHNSGLSGQHTTVHEVDFLTIETTDTSI